MILSRAFLFRNEHKGIAHLHVRDHLCTEWLLAQLHTNDSSSQHATDATSQVSIHRYYVGIGRPETLPPSPFALPMADLGSS